MPWSGSGTFSRSHDWTDDRDSGIKILASRMDTEDDGFATGINATLAKNGENAATGNLNLGGNRFTNASTSVSARSDLAPVSVVQDGSIKFATASGTDTYTISLSPAITAYANGQTFVVKFTNANTGAATLNVNGVGAVSLTKNQGTALASGNIPANSMWAVRYNSTGPRFDMVGLLTGVFEPADATIIRGALGSTDNVIPRSDGTGGLTLQNSVATIADTTGSITVAGTGTHSSVIQGSGAGVDWRLDRTDTHGDNVLVGSFIARGRDSGGATQDYGAIDVRAVLDNAGAETGAIEFRTGDAGGMTQRLHIATGVYTTNATGGNQGADTINAGNLFHNGVRAGFVAPAAQATTSGNGVTFGSIPAGVNQIWFILNEVSVDDTDNLLIQIGTGAALTTTGYVSTTAGTSNGAANSTAGFIIRSSNAAHISSGIMHLCHMGSNLWIASYAGKASTGDAVHGGGSVTLAGALDIIGIVDSGGDAFDGGSVRIFYT